MLMVLIFDNITVICLYLEQITRYPKLILLLIIYVFYQIIQILLL